MDGDALRTLGKSRRDAKDQRPRPISRESSKGRGGEAGALKGKKIKKKTPALKAQSNEGWKEWEKGKGGTACAPTSQKEDKGDKG